MFTLTKSDMVKEKSPGKSNKAENHRRLRRFVNHVTHDTRDTLAATQRQVREHPLRAGAIAAGVGFILGVILRRR